MTWIFKSLKLGLPSPPTRELSIKIVCVCVCVYGVYSYHFLTEKRLRLEGGRGPK